MTIFSKCDCSERRPLPTQRKEVPCEETKRILSTSRRKISSVMNQPIAIWVSLVSFFYISCLFIIAFWVSWFYTTYSGFALLSFVNLSIRRKKNNQTSYYKFSKWNVISYSEQVYFSVESCRQNGVALLVWFRLLRFHKQNRKSRSENPLFKTR